MASVELPDFFEPMLLEQYERTEVERILRGCHAHRAVTLRANTLKADAAEIAAALDAAGIAYERVGWYEDAFILRGAHERDIWDLPVYQEGKVYLQSLSSMIPALALGAQAGQDVCDICAAPGGKTTQIAALAGGRAYLTACEMHAPRAEKLEHNLRKQGAANVTIMRTDARRLDDFFSFDRVLLDAPCSGSGTLDVRDARMPKRFTSELLKKSQKSQRALFAKALNLLKPGSVLVYSTCSVLACENEDIVEEGLRNARRKGDFQVQPIVAEPAELAVEDAGDAAGVAGASAGFQGDQAAFTTEAASELPFLPTRIPGTLCLAPTDLYEGFFVAKIKRVS